MKQAAPTTDETPERAWEPDRGSMTPDPEPVRTVNVRRISRRGSLQDYRAWIWMIPALLGLLVIGMMVQRTEAPKPTPSFSLRANEVGGDLRIEWDRNAEPIREATRGTIDIKDGTISVPITLDALRVRDGYFNYTRVFGDLEIKMTVYRAKGNAVTELATFVGPPVAPRASTDRTAEVTLERDRLRAELEQVRESLRKQTARNRQLEDTVRILQQRVQVQELLKPKQ